MLAALEEDEKHPEMYGSVTRSEVTATVAKHLEALHELRAELAQYGAGFSRKVDEVLAVDTDGAAPKHVAVSSERVRITLRDVEGFEAGRPNVVIMSDGDVGHEYLDQFRNIMVRAEILR